MSELENDENVEPIMLRVTEHYQAAYLLLDGSIALSQSELVSHGIRPSSPQPDDSVPSVSFDICVHVNVSTGSVANLPVAEPPSSSQREQLRLAAWSARALRCDRELSRLRYAARRLIKRLAPRLGLRTLPRQLTPTELSVMRFADRLGLRHGDRCCCCCQRRRLRCQEAKQRRGQPAVCLGTDPSDCLNQARRDAARLMRLLVPNWRSSGLRRRENSCSTMDIAQAMLRAAESGTASQGADGAVERS